MILIFASLIPDHPSLGDNLRYQFVGFMIVMLVLATLWFQIQFVGGIFKMAAARVKPLPSQAPGTAPTVTGSLPPEIVAAIAAVAHVCIREPHRVVSVQSVAASQSAVNIQAWSVEGRRQIFSSHSVR